MMPVDRILGALAGLALGVPLLLVGAVPYAIFFVVGTGHLLGHPPLLFDRRHMTDFGPDVTTFGTVVYTVVWFLPFVVAGAALGPWVRRVVRG